MKINSILGSYIETALWSSNDDENGFDELSFSDISPETIQKMQSDLDQFVSKAGDLLDGLDLEQVAHDFWLTRNGHGAGFWDGDYEQDIGEKLTDLAHSFGETDLYVGDDGMVYAA
jgi:hypothetical protein